MPNHSEDDMHQKLNQALHTIEVLRQRVDEAHNKYDTLMELFQAYIHKDSDNSRPKPDKQEKVNRVNC